MSNSATPRTVTHQAPLSMGILQARILEWVAILQGIFSTQGSNPSLPHCRWILYHLSHQGSSLQHCKKYNLLLLQYNYLLSPFPPGRYYLSQCQLRIQYWERSLFCLFFHPENLFCLSFNPLVYLLMGEEEFLNFIHCTSRYKRYTWYGSVIWGIVRTDLYSTPIFTNSNPQRDCIWRWAFKEAIRVK